MSMSYDKYEPQYPPHMKDRPPNEADQRNNAKLKEFTTREIILETEEEMERRRLILLELNRIFVQWVKSVAMDVRKMSEEEASEVGGKLLISGSHRLNVREPGADIDTICVAPEFCTRENFFSTLKQKLLNHPDVKELVAVETARVPMIGMEFRGVSIDLLFARLSSDNVPEKEEDFYDDKILRNLDEATEISLNGPRVTQLIAELISKNFENKTFHELLRCVRLWAKRRGLYGNMFGYLGSLDHCQTHTHMHIALNFFCGINCRRN